MANVNPVMFNKMSRELQRKAIAASTGGTVNLPKEKTRKKRFSKLKTRDLVFGN